MNDPTNALAQAREKIQSIGQQTSAPIFEEMKRLYAPLQLQAVAETLTVQRDLTYGPHARHRLNVFSSGTRGSPARDVLVFVHGGGFVMGDKEETPGAFYDNVGIWAAGEGLIGVTINYRLAPANAWPAGTDDVSAAIAWVQENIARFGGNPQRMFLFGHSAGAAHVAGFLTDVERAQSIAGCICLSGVYGLEVAPVNAAYFGEDASLYPERSPLAGLARAQTPLLVLLTEFDPEFIQRHALSLLSERLAAHHSLPYFAQIPGHNHFTGILHLNSEDRSLVNEIVKFRQHLCELIDRGIRQVRASGAARPSFGVKR